MSEKNIVCRVTISSVAKMGSPAAQPVLQCKLEYAEGRVNSEQNNTLQACHFAFDDRGTIGKRYRRQDEIGTPFCVTYDFDSEEDGAVTVRDRDTMQQERIKIDELDAYFEKKFEF